MENVKEQYEKPKLEITSFNDQDVLTTSLGDGWVKDPFEED